MISVRDNALAVPFNVFVHRHGNRLGQFELAGKICDGRAVRQVQYCLSVGFWRKMIFEIRMQRDLDADQTGTHSNPSSSSFCCVGFPVATSQPAIR